MGTAIAARTPMMIMTTRSSIRVKPSSSKGRRALPRLVHTLVTAGVSTTARAPLTALRCADRAHIAQTKGRPRTKVRGRPDRAGSRLRAEALFEAARCRVAVAVHGLVTLGVRD